MTKPDLQVLEAQNEQRRLSKEALLTPRRVERDVEVTSLEGTIKLRSLTYGQREDIKQRALKVGKGQIDEDTFNLLTIVESIVEPDLGEEDILALKAQDASVIDEISMQIQFINMTGEAKALKKGSSKTTN